MRVEEAVRRLNGYLQRRGKVDGSGGWTEEYLLDLLTDANMDMYHRVVNYGPEIFQLSDHFVYEKDAESVDLNSKLSGLPMAIWYAGILNKNEDLGPNNLPSPIQMVRRTNLDQSGYSGGIRSSTVELVTNGASFSLNGVGGYNSFQGYYLGRRFSLRSIPSEDVYVYMRWTPDALAPLLDKDQDLLNGFLPQFHPAIVYKAAIQAKSAKGEDISQLNALYQDAIGQYDSNIKMGCKQRQRQQPQQRDPMRWEY
tara:strand:- start:10516 stop:11277 length:762 start_codon:yes stop_codon:yes gene_type:complete